MATYSLTRHAPTTLLALALATSAALLCSCGPKPLPPPTPADRVQVSLAPGEVQAYPMAFGWTMPARFQQAQQEKKTLCTVPAWPGLLFEVSVKEKAAAGEKEDKFARFFFVYPRNWHAIGRLDFRLANYGVSLHGHPIFVDLALKDAPAALAAFTDAQRSQIRSVALTGNPEIDLPALAKLKGSGVFVTIPKEFLATPAYLAALAAVKPLGLQTENESQLDALLAAMPDVQCLIAQGPKLPSLKSLPHLQHLQFRFTSEKGENDLAPLRECLQLQVLMLAEPANSKPFTNLAVLREMPNLWSFLLLQPATKESLAAVGECRNLRSLMIEVGQKADLKPLVSLQRLQYLTLWTNDENTEVDLTPLADLKQLCVVVLPKKYMEKRPQDVNALKAKRPDLEIIGFCMGSGWLVLLLPLAVAAGLIWRRMRGMGILPMCATAVPAVSGRVRTCRGHSATADLRLARVPDDNG